MTGLADDASPTLPGIEGPMVGGQATGVDLDGETPWARLSDERGAEPDGERGEATIEADGKVARRRTGDGHRGVEVGFRECERLLDPDVLAGPERRADEFAVFSVAGRDEDRGQSRMIE